MALPSGTVTFLFTDIEGSTRLLQEVGEEYVTVLREHHSAMRAALGRHGGVEVDTEGDAFFVAFASARDAVAAATAAQQLVVRLPVRVRMGMHTGEPALTEDGYVGIDVHRAARICSAAHGGQIVVSARTHDLVDGGAFLDLGRHRLKDLLEPERLYQVGAGEFPPLRSLNATNLPIQPTPLVGRESELTEVLGLLRAGPTRLLTLTGAGGSGKTRLALQAAAELVDEFVDGVFWVSLAALTDPELVVPTVAQTIGAKDGLADHVDEKRLLLLLDNFEQLLPAAAALGDLLGGCPNVRLLVTSRAVLHLAAEQEYEVPPLPESDAVRLFVQRARQSRAGFEADEHVEEICRRLDGLPLAIELAAARVKVLQPRELLARLARSSDVLAAAAVDLPERQRTLRATIEWSYGLLERPERELFDRLGVFPGSFDLEAAEAICSAGLDALAALVDKSLVRRTAEGRFFLLETIREYAVERLDAVGDGEGVRARHTDHFFDLAVAESDDPVGRLDVLDTELDNLRGAFEQLLAAGRNEEALRLSIAIYDLWETRDRFAEGDHWFRRATAHPGLGRTALVGRAKFWHAGLASHLNDLARARRLAEEAVAILRDTDPTEYARALGGLAYMHTMSGDLDRAAPLFAEALEILRGRGTRHALRATLHAAGEFERYRDHFDDAAALLDESLALSLELGDMTFAASTLHSLGDVALDRVDLDGAESRYREAIASARNQPGNDVLCLAGLAAVSALRGEAERAARLWAAVEAYEVERGTALHVHERPRYERALAAADLPNLEEPPLSLEDAVAHALDEA